MIQLRRGWHSRNSALVASVEYESQSDDSTGREATPRVGASDNEAPPK